MVFLAKKYLVDLPTHLQYVKLLEDFDLLAQQSNPQNSAGNLQQLCTYLRKACLAYHNALEPSHYFRTKCVQYPGDCLMTPGDFMKAVADLKLGPEVIGSDQVVMGLYAEIDSANTKKVTMD